jgi:glycine/D-amino acid oxidase-like deaminating enzyme
MHSTLINNETYANMAAAAIASDFQERSYWWDAMPPVAANPVLPRSVDVAIVGAGVTGLNAAIELARAGKSVAVFDAGDAGFGASTRNTGFLGRFLKTSFSELSRHYGPEKATAYYSELYTALNVSLKDVIQREGIDCDFAVSGRVVLARSAKQLDGVVSEFTLRQKHLGEEVHVLNPSQLRQEIRCSDRFCGGVYVPDMAAIHPGKYVAGLLAAATRLGVEIFSNARVSRTDRVVDGYKVDTALGALRAKDVIIATNGYSGKDLNWFRKRLVPFQGFVIATEEMPQERIRQLLPTNRSYTDDDFDTMAIRATPDGKRIITSGRTGRSLPLPEKVALLRQDLLGVFPDLSDVKVSYAWSGFCAAPFDAMPKIGRREDGVWYAIGFTFMGMPQGSYFGRKVAFQLLDKPEGKTIYSGTPFKAPLFYTGTPWFLAPYMALMRAKDKRANG